MEWALGLDTFIRAAISTERTPLPSRHRSSRTSRYLMAAGVMPGMQLDISNLLGEGAGEDAELPTSPPG